MRAAIYARLSRNPDGTKDATDRQLAAMRPWIAERGWSLAGEYIDDDRSAYRAGVVREGYERMLLDLAAGSLDVVVTWRTDRLLRRVVEWGRFWGTCEEAGAQFVSQSEGIDTTTPFGQAMVAILVALAKLESDNISTRTRAKHEYTARKGSPPPGGVRPFGHTRGWHELEPEEAEAIRNAARRVLAGESLHSIVTEWDRGGIRSPATSRHPAGRPWRLGPLRRMLMQPRLAGLREHRGAVVAEGTFPAILDLPTWEVLRETLRARRAARGVQRRSKYLLTSLLVCGRCGGRLSGRTRRGGRRAYACGPRPGGGCWNSIAAGPLDDLVRDMVLYQLDTPALAAALREHDEDLTGEVDRLHTDEAALETLATDFYVEHRIGRAEFFAAHDALVRRIKEARTRLARNGQGIAATAAGQGESLRARWEEAGQDWRRDLIGALIEHITIAPLRTRGGPRIDPERVRPIWRV